MWLRNWLIGESVAHLDAKLVGLEGTLDGIQRRLDAVRELHELVAQAQRTAHEAAARAQDALDLVSDLAVIPEIVNDLKTAVAHGIEHVERTEARIRATVQRARAELSDDDKFHPGLEAEAESIRHNDELVGGGGRMRLLPESLAEPLESSSQALTSKLRAMGLSA
jgi:DNA repair exonuclease SbcCD ATPase subunit